MYRILVVEDDEAIREQLTLLLKANGFEVTGEPPCDLALLDVNLKDGDGFEYCRRLRLTCNVPVIFLTARSRVEDEIIGFGVGGDDYIKKPYNSSVLLMRINRLLHNRGDFCERKGLKLNLSALSVSYGGKTAELTKNETRILYCIMQNDVCPKEKILDELWNSSLYIDENTLYVNINRLRGKLNSIGADNFIATVRGVGYKL